MDQEGDLSNLQSIQFGEHTFIYYTSAVFKSWNGQRMITVDLPRLQSLVLKESALSGSSFNKNSSIPLSMKNTLVMESTSGE